MSMIQSSIVALIIAVVVVLVALGSRRPTAGEPFRRRPSAIVLVVTVLIIAGLCAFLATRHGV
jgi:hypothetical protein